MMTDPVADMLTRIRNALMAGHEKVEIPASRLKAGICRALKEEGYIGTFKILIKAPGDMRIKINLKPGAIVGLKRFSRPGLRQYRGYRDIPRTISGLGISILSTSRGIISDRRAKIMKVGGEVLCCVW